MLDLSTLPRAVMAEDDADVLLHRGRPAHEYRDFLAGRAVVVLPQLRALAVTGADRLTWLHTLTSQHLAGLRPGTPTEALLLTPNGRITAALGLIDDGERVTAYLDRSIAEQTREYLERMKFASRVEVELLDDPVLALCGPAIEDPPLAVSALWRDPWPHVAGGTTFTPPGVTPDVTPTALCTADADALDRLATEDPEAFAGRYAYDAVRIANWRPAYGTEVDDRSIPPELDWLRTAVHLNKGCYCGQEAIARVVNLGRPPRRLVFLHLDGSAEHLPEPGAPVAFGAKPVGHVTSAVRHPELGPVALAVVKRNTPPDAALLVDEVPASQEIIVSPDGVSAARPEHRVGEDLRGVRNRGLQPPKQGGINRR